MDEICKNCWNDDCKKQSDEFRNSKLSDCKDLNCGMSDLISRNALLEELDKREYSREKHDFKRIIENQPTATGLTNDEIDCFNSYIEKAKMDIAFGNTDWCSIYHKIVGERVSEYAKEKMDLYNS